jgi:electron transfer flavoprotein alpha subunit
VSAAGTFVAEARGVSEAVAEGSGAGEAVAVVVARDGRLPVGADQAVAEAGGSAIVVGSGAETAARSLVAARRAWWAETTTGLRPGNLAAQLAPVVGGTALVILPASPDGRDLAPRLAARLDRPLVDGAISAGCRTDRDGGTGTGIRATVSRLDDRVLMDVEVDGPAVVTLMPGSRTVEPVVTGVVEPLGLPAPTVETAGSGGPLDPEVVAILEPDLHTMDLSDATRVVAGGAGLVVGADDHRAAQVFDLLVEVAAALGGSAGATRVATDAGWTGYERQIGTTGVTIDPELYIALGVSGAVQHIGGVGSPRHVVSVNTDASAPMTALADLGLVTDAQGLLMELGRRFGVDMPPGLSSRPEADRG